MKIINLILPIMALTTLNNNIEIKDISSLHQLEVKDLDVMKSEILLPLITPINIKEGREEKIISHSAGCDALYRSIMDTCNALTGAKKTACQAAAYSSYLICLGAGGDITE